jgi:carboxymethylenebutenolidase
MLINESFIDLSVTLPSGQVGTMRTHVFRPVGDQGSLGGICLWSEIYQVTGPVRRLGRQLASEGFIVAAPEVYHEFEPPVCTLMTHVAC